MMMKVCQGRNDIQEKRLLIQYDPLHYQHDVRSIETNSCKK